MNPTLPHITHYAIARLDMSQLNPNIYDRVLYTQLLKRFEMLKVH
ncbi:MAG: hypothetical protein J07HQW1_02376 [Haloquadratum walsbyi J07HQW1]|uniref:Uncharacterized protein n=1 Tax=Haloquadratum walsbyi J07HQW1 TaxID=1238424 RepID=U1N6Q9_9EURY|nr:MAG: hypothetical protein J07HQW1_02376 [Haloquadratum walsbyi J07HQW1]